MNQPVETSEGPNIPSPKKISGTNYNIIFDPHIIPPEIETSISKLLVTNWGALKQFWGYIDNYLSSLNTRSPFDHDHFQLLSRVCLSRKLGSFASPELSGPTGITLNDFVTLLSLPKLLSHDYLGDAMGTKPGKEKKFVYHGFFDNNDNLYLVSGARSNLACTLIGNLPVTKQNLVDFRHNFIASLFFPQMPSLCPIAVGNFNVRFPSRFVYETRGKCLIANILIINSFDTTAPKRTQATWVQRAIFPLFKYSDPELGGFSNDEVVTPVAFQREFPIFYSQYFDKFLLIEVPKFEFFPSEKIFASPPFSPFSYSKTGPEDTPIKITSKEFLVLTENERQFVHAHEITPPSSAASSRETSLSPNPKKAMSPQEPISLGHPYFSIAADSSSIRAIVTSLHRPPHSSKKRKHPY